MSFVSLILLFLSLRTLCTILGTTLSTVCHTCGIKSSTYDVITYTRQVFHTTATHKHD